MKGCFRIERKQPFSFLLGVVKNINLLTNTHIAKLKRILYLPHFETKSENLIKQNKYV